MTRRVPRVGAHAELPAPRQKRAAAAALNHALGAAIGAALAAVALQGCGRGDDVTPPRIVYDETECEQCRMLISDERFAAGLVLRQAGELRKLAFDDVGCLVEAVSEALDDQEVDLLVPYVHDLETLAWLDAREAVFVRSDELRTPMASNLAAARDRDAAQRVLARFPGTIETFESVLGHPRRPDSASAGAPRGVQTEHHRPAPPGRAERPATPDA